MNAMNAMESNGMKRFHTFAIVTQMRRPMPPPLKPVLIGVPVIGWTVSVTLTVLGRIVWDRQLWFGITNLISAVVVCDYLLAIIFVTIKLRKELQTFIACVTAMNTGVGGLVIDTTEIRAAVRSLIILCVCGIPIGAVNLAFMLLNAANGFMNWTEPRPLPPVRWTTINVLTNVASYAVQIVIMWLAFPPSVVSVSVSKSNSTLHKSSVVPNNSVQT